MRGLAIKVPLLSVYIRYLETDFCCLDTSAKVNSKRTAPPVKPGLLGALVCVVSER